MHDFKYKNNQLYCESVRVEDLAKRFGTPLYVYSYNTLIDHFLKLKTAFSKIKPLICYSVKANSNLAILKALIAQGAGLDIVSGGELFYALKAGCPSNRIVYASVGKTDKEIEEAIKIKILFFNVESLSELENIQRIAKKLKRTVNISIRINPDIEPKTHKYITTGKLTNKFGIDFDTASKIFFQKSKFSNLNICGIHIHIGSQIIDSKPYICALKKISNYIEFLEKNNVRIEYLNIGGGLGIIYNKEKPQTAKSFALSVLPLLKKFKGKLILEPGRFIVGNAGILVTKILYIKTTPLKKFIIVDAGMNDLIRPALYGAYHQILPLSKKNKKRQLQKVDVVGPICESADFFAKDRFLPQLKEGEYLAIMGSGAYGFSMSSNYNGRLKPAEILVKNRTAILIRRRQNYFDLIREQV
ncbi:MAG: diaminopimelate decarboxylase [Candidatus Omnitrophica bacterium]|nr:diaminopimelate decarboxylase [Candidatus Omnitrophota bacterium]